MVKKKTKFRAVDAQLFMSFQHRPKFTSHREVKSEKSEPVEKKKEKNEKKKIVEKKKDEKPKKEIKEIKKKEVKKESYEKKEAVFKDPIFSSNPFALLSDDGDEMNDSTMVESNPQGAFKQKHVHGGASAKKGKNKSKKKNKNKTGGNNAGYERTVILKNPLYNNSNSETMSMMKYLQTPRYDSPMDQQPAHHENGMFTSSYPEFVSSGGGDVSPVASETPSDHYIQPMTKKEKDELGKELEEALLQPALLIFENDHSDFEESDDELFINNGIDVQSIHFWYLIREKDSDEE